jgi:hypothetical protein
MRLARFAKVMYEKEEAPGTPDLHGTLKRFSEWRTGLTVNRSKTSG